MFLWKLIKLAILIAGGYLLGNFSTGIVVSKLFADFDIRTKGSGNTGATNMLRTLGWVPSLLTFAGDALKGVLACLLGSALLGMPGAYIAGLACVAGHNWPALFGFRGGKGVATSFGVLLFTCPVIAISVLILQIAIVALTKTMSIASICSGLLNAVLSLFLLHRTPFFMVCGFVITALLLFQHRENIIRLLGNRENKLDFSRINRIKAHLHRKGGK